MQGMSERQYAAHVGLSRGAIQKAKTAERLVLYPDGSINAAASDARRAETTDPSKTRKPPAPSKSVRPSPLSPEVGPDLGKLVEVGAYMSLQHLLHRGWLHGNLLACRVAA